jgi:hypothetical protein
LVHNEEENGKIGIIREEVRYIRKRLDDHVDREDLILGVIEDKISKTREEMSTYRAQVTGLVAFLALIITGLITWLFNSI